jgi:hypothetical protein
MTLTTLVAVFSIIGVVLGIPALIFTARQQALNTAAARQAEIDRAVAPVAADRDYWRDRADAFETELRNSRGK